VGPANRIHPASFARLPPPLNPHSHQQCRRRIRIGPRSRDNVCVTRRSVHLTLAILLVPLLGILTFFLHEGLLQPAVDVADGTLTVKTRVRETYRIAEMTELALQSRLPEVLRKDEGLARGGRLSGRFSLRGLGSGRVIVTVQAPPYIFLRTPAGFLFLNLADPNETRALYQSLMREWHPLPPAASSDDEPGR
jgi:hypothetical protein